MSRRRKRKKRKRGSESDDEEKKKTQTPFQHHVGQVVISCLNRNDKGKRKKQKDESKKICKTKRTTFQTSVIPSGANGPLSIILSFCDPIELFHDVILVCKGFQKVANFMLEKKMVVFRKEHFDVIADGDSKLKLGEKLFIRLIPYVFQVDPGRCVQFCTKDMPYSQAAKTLLIDMKSKLFTDLKKESYLQKAYKYCINQKLSSVAKHLLSTESTIPFELRVSEIDYLKLTESDLVKFIVENKNIMRKKEFFQLLKSSREHLKFMEHPQEFRKLLHYLIVQMPSVIRKKNQAISSYNTEHSLDVPQYIDNERRRKFKTARQAHAYRSRIQQSISVEEAKNGVMLVPLKQYFVPDSSDFTRFFYNRFLESDNRCFDVHNENHLETLFWALGEHLWVWDGPNGIVDKLDLSKDVLKKFLDINQEGSRDFDLEKNAVVQYVLEEMKKGKKKSWLQVCPLRMEIEVLGWKLTHKKLTQRKELEKRLEACVDQYLAEDDPLSVMNLRDSGKRHAGDFVKFRFHWFENSNEGIMLEGIVKKILEHRDGPKFGVFIDNLKKCVQFGKVKMAYFLYDYLRNEKYNVMMNSGVEKWSWDEKKEVSDIIAAVLQKRGHEKLLKKVLAEISGKRWIMPELFVSALGSEKKFVSDDFCLNLLKDLDYFSDGTWFHNKFKSMFEVAWKHGRHDVCVALLNYFSTETEKIKKLKEEIKMKGKKMKKAEEEKKAREQLVIREIKLQEKFEYLNVCERLTEMLRLRANIKDEERERWEKLTCKMISERLWKKNTIYREEKESSEALARRIYSKLSKFEYYYHDEKKAMKRFYGVPLDQSLMKVACEAIIMVHDEFKVENHLQIIKMHYGKEKDYSRPCVPQRRWIDFVRWVGMKTLVVQCNKCKKKVDLLKICKPQKKKKKSPKNEILFEIRSVGIVKKREERKCEEEEEEEFSDDDEDDDDGDFEERDEESQEVVFYCGKKCAKSHKMEITLRKEPSNNYDYEYESDSD